mmetsp:Transcript_30580/g.34883  ORF Transcript_30580/g.34883 Transcript_30580/m.34883 type:complete len:196 (+) Transcript_30580:56-643(+)
MTTPYNKVPAADNKVYFSYADVHATITSLHPFLQEFKPDVIVAIGGGGFIPARILRSVVKKPILAVSLELYDDSTNTPNMKEGVKILQWFDIQVWPASLVPGGNVLIVDDVDDTRITLQYCVEQIQKSNPSKIGVAVIHNKRKEKIGTLPENVDYFAGMDVLDHWNCYPWDAETYRRDVLEHEKLARSCTREIEE